MPRIRSPMSVPISWSTVGIELAGRQVVRGEVEPRLAVGLREGAGDPELAAGDREAVDERGLAGGSDLGLEGRDGIAGRRVERGEVQHVHDAACAAALPGWALAHGLELAADVDRVAASGDRVDLTVRHPRVVGSVAERGGRRGRRAEQHRGCERERQAEPERASRSSASVPPDVGGRAMRHRGYLEGGSAPRGERAPSVDVVALGHSDQADLSVLDLELRQRAAADGDAPAVARAGPGAWRPPGGSSRRGSRRRHALRRAARP